MKKIKYLGYSFSLLLMIAGCQQENVELKDPCEADPSSCAPDTSCEDAEAGSLDLTKFIAVGNSFVAGVQGGALFTTGQQNSLAAIINKQLECAGAPSTFKQPDINATLGWNLFLTQPFESNTSNPVLGRMLLQYNGGTSPTPTPQAYQPGNLEAVPNPIANPGFIYAGSKTELNNFAVPAITVGQVLSPATGNWADPDKTKGFNPFYARFASNPGTSRIITDAVASGGTTALVWLGLDDFLLYAAFGADATKAPLTDPTTFGSYFGAVFGHPSIGMLTLNPNLKAVVGNLPDIFTMPYFTSVSYKPIPLPQANADALTAGFAGYNAAIEGLKNAAFGGAFGTAAELDARKLTFVAGNNAILITDESILDLEDGFDALLGAGAITAEQREALAPYEQVRQTTAADIIPLLAGSVLGKPGTFGLLGVSEPLGDQYAIVPAEKTAINDARTAYNTAITNTVNAFPDNLVLADVSGALSALLVSKAAVYNGVTITPNINPPTGIYSEDGIHPNTRGYAFLSRVFIQALNTKFGATIPLTKLSDYKATGLPIP
jgi:hypothetical protein